MIYAVLSLACWWFATILMEQVKKILLMFDIWTYEIHGQKLSKRIYPLDCEKCLGFWVGLFYAYSWSYQPLLSSLVLGATTSALAIFIAKIYRAI